jgi:hypothetical protein
MANDQHRLDRHRLHGDFRVVFGYLTYVEQDVVAPVTDTPTATIDESER